MHAWYARRAETLPGRVTKKLGRMSWHPGSHPPRQMHFEKGDLHAGISLSWVTTS